MPPITARQNGCTDTDRPPSADLWWPLTLELSVTYELLKTRHHLHILRAHGVKLLVFFFFFMMIRMVLLRMVAIDNLSLSSLLFLLYHICHHSFLKSCYLKKCFKFFCVLSLFSFSLMLLKMGRSLTSVVILSEADVTYLRNEGAVWPPTSRGRHAEMQRLVSDWLKHHGLSAHSRTKPILLLSWDSDVCLQHFW